MDVATPDKPPLKLDAAPPVSPDTVKRASLVDLEANKRGSGLGEYAGDPKIVALNGMSKAEQGVNEIMSVFPQLPPQILEAVAALKQMVLQMVAGAGLGAPGMAGAPPQAGGAVMPMPMPPGGAGGPMPPM